METKRAYTIPLRREFSKVARWKRSKRAIHAIKKFLVRHMKAEQVTICNELNEFVWQNGVKSPPPRVEVEALSIQKDGMKVVVVNLASKGVNLDKLGYNKKAASAVQAQEVMGSAPQQTLSDAIDAQYAVKNEEKAIDHHVADHLQTQTGKK